MGNKTGRSIWWGHICFLCKFSFWWWTNTSVGSWGNNNMVPEQCFLNIGFQTACIRITWVHVRWNFWVPFQIYWARNLDGIQEYAFYQAFWEALVGYQMRTWGTAVGDINLRATKDWVLREARGYESSVRSKLLLKRKASERRVGKWKRGRVRTGWGRQGPGRPLVLEDIEGTISVEGWRQMEDNLEN